MRELPPSARRYIVAIAGVAAICLTVALGFGPRASGQELIVAAFLAIGVTLAWKFPVRLRANKHLFVDIAPVVLAVLVLPIGWAMLAVGGGTIAAQLLRRRPWDLAEIGFNGSQNALFACAGSSTLWATGVDPSRPLTDQPVAVFAVPVAVLTMVFVNGGALSTMIALQRGRSVWRTFVDTTLREDPVDLINIVSLSGLAVIAAILLDEHAWAGTLLLPPVIATLITLRRHTQRHEEAAIRLAGSQSSLAVAQRIAGLGNWEWDLATNSHRWSEQVSRVLGFAEPVAEPTLAHFLDRVHAEDHARVERALADGKATGLLFSLDHRIVCADGAERAVHLQGEVERDAWGRNARMRGTIHDITERKALEAQLAHRAYHDPLTALPNRARFIECLERALSTPLVHRGVAVLFLDLDGFKLVNDGLGHNEGDRLLVLVADRLRSCVGPRALAARFGGDEFTVYVDAPAIESAAVDIGDRILAALSEPFTLGVHEAAIGVSIGIAIAAGGDIDAQGLMRDADTALYKAKSSGKSRIVVFEPTMNADAVRKLDLGSSLRRALERGEISLRYQPIVDLATGRLAGVEALLRWEHPTEGLVPPDEFVPLAEESGAILPIGDWILREACAQAAAWDRRYPEAGRLRVGVNLSKRQLHTSELASSVTRVLRETGLRPEQLELEITEMIDASELRAISSTLESIQSRGVRLSLDDVGTGESSLGRFRQIRFDSLKLDRLFVAGLDQDIRSVAVAEAVTSLANRLEIDVTAEGIESVDDIVQARTLGCRFGQGYLFGRPLESTEIENLLRRNTAFDVAQNVVVGPRWTRPVASPDMTLPRSPHAPTVIGARSIG